MALCMHSLPYHFLIHEYSLSIKIVAALDECYEYIETLISPSQVVIPPGISCSEAYGVTDAMVFGHIAGWYLPIAISSHSHLPSNLLNSWPIDALCIEELVDVLQRRRKLMKFFEEVCRTYFTVDGVNDACIWDNYSLHSENTYLLRSIIDRCQVLSMNP